MRTDPPGCSRSTPIGRWSRIGPSSDRLGVDLLPEARRPDDPSGGDPRPLYTKKDPGAMKPPPRRIFAISLVLASALPGCHRGPDRQLVYPRRGTRVQV